MKNFEVYRLTSNIYLAISAGCWLFDRVQDSIYMVLCAILAQLFSISQREDKDESVK